MSDERNEFGWRKLGGGRKMTPNGEADPQENQEMAELPSMYEVFLVNDGQTPMDFFTLLLKKFFNKSQEEATYVTLETHKRGQGLCGKFTRDVAETKITLVSDYAHKYNYEIKCVMQKESCHAIKKP